MLRRAAALLLALTASGLAAASSLELSLRPVFNGDPLLLDSLRYQNSAGETVSFSRISFLISGVAVQREDGVWLGIPDSNAWFDAAARRLSATIGGLPPARYRALRFFLGPDPADNAREPGSFPAGHPLNPALNGLHWSWQGGYIFLALEGNFRTGAGQPSGYALHLARDPNRTRLTFPTALDLTHDAGVLLDFDLGALLNAPRPLSFARDGTATHSREGDPVSAALAANLPGAFRVRQVTASSPLAGRSAPVAPLYLPKTYTPYRFTMSASFPLPDLPRDNPLLTERVELGEKLFHETALSRDGTLSCASCHVDRFSFSDARRVSSGVEGRKGTRNSMALINLAWKGSFFWDGRAPSLRAQALQPIQDHAEMDESLERVAGKLAASPGYPARFEAAFGSPEVTPEKVGLALEQFLLTLTSFDSKFDRALRGEATLTDAEKRGFELFVTEYEPRTGQRGADCFHCHGGALFTDHQFHNNGLKPDPADTGRMKVTGAEADRGKFSTPTLRNVEKTAPYMHDGRFATLEEVVDHYDHGVVRSPALDPNISKNPEGRLNLATEDRQALVAFLRTLTDERLLTR